MTDEPAMTRLALFGAAPDTPNMGVSALFMSAIAGIAKHIDPVEFVVFDNGLGRRDTTLTLPGGKTVKLIRFGARGGRRYHRPENLASMLRASRLGRLGAALNEGIRLIDSCAAVFDVSGGDSFSDIYGRKRFDLIHRPKAIAINRGIPLILLPQTYGPYKDTQVRTLAAQAVRGASMAWARDEHSFEILKGLLGEHFNPEIHRCGVDMAFSLPPSPAGHLLPEPLKTWLTQKEKLEAALRSEAAASTLPPPPQAGEGPGERASIQPSPCQNPQAPVIPAQAGIQPASRSPLIGFNVSGLIYNNPEAAKTQYGFKADYRQVVVGFLGKVLAESPAKIVLISHVMDQPGHYESDLAACQDVARQLGEQYADRVIVAPATLDQSQAKWLIAQMDWFCGTRMHSTIAGLSSGVPTAAVSYSDKTKGVFETCGQGAQVQDPRRFGEAEMIERLNDSFICRELLRASLVVGLPPVQKMANEQIRTCPKIYIRRTSRSQCY